VNTIPAITRLSIVAKTTTTGDKPECYRVVLVDPPTDRVAWVRLDHDEMPAMFPLSDLQKKLTLKEFVIQEQDPWRQRFLREESPNADNQHTATEKQYTATENKYLKDYWTRFAPHVQEQSLLQLFNRWERRSAVAKIAADLQISPQTALKLVLRYLKHGLVEAAILPHYDACGTRGKHRHCTERVGPHRTLPNVKNGVPMTDDFRIRIAQMVYGEYAQQDGMTLNAAVENVQRHLYPGIHTDKNGYVMADEDQDKDLCVFSKEQIRIAFHSVYDSNAILQIRLGKQRYNTSVRARTGNNPGVRPLAPGMEYQFDSTPLDFYLKGVELTSDRLARMKLCLLVDTCTHAIVGSALTDAESAEALRLTLYNAITSKIPINKMFGVPMSPDEPDMVGVPQCILSDNGAAIAHDLESMCLSLGIQIKNAPVNRGDYKAQVENRNRYIADLIIQMHTAGRIRKHPLYSASGTVAANGVLDVTDTEKYIAHAVHRYNIDCHSAFKRSAAMREAGILPIPTELWKWAITNMGGGLTSIAPDIARRLLLPSYEADVPREGVKWHKIIYVPDTAQDAHNDPAEAAVILSLSNPTTSKQTPVVRLFVDPRDITQLVYVGRLPSTPLVRCRTQQTDQYPTPTPLLQQELMDQHDREQISIAEAAVKPRVDADLDAIESIINNAVSRSYNEKLAVTLSTKKYNQLVADISAEVRATLASAELSPKNGGKSEEQYADAPEPTVEVLAANDVYGQAVNKHKEIRHGRKT